MNERPDYTRKIIIDKRTGKPIQTAAVEVNPKTKETR